MQVKNAFGALLVSPVQMIQSVPPIIESGIHHG
jgi:hypothetical protein